MSSFRRVDQECPRLGESLAQGLNGVGFPKRERAQLFESGNEDLGEVIHFFLCPGSRNIKCGREDLENRITLQIKQQKEQPVSVTFELGLSSASRFSLSRFFGHQ